MTEAIFHDVLTGFNKNMILQKRNILSFIDNCSAHSHNLDFSNIKIAFLPMDARVIKCLKGAYIVKLARKLVH